MKSFALKLLRTGDQVLSLAQLKQQASTLAAVFSTYCLGDAEVYLA
jgi:hypothetical protein